MNKKVTRTAFYDSIPVLTGYVVLGMGFGIVLKQAGYGFFWALAMSVFIYAGSMQYVAIPLMTEGSPYLVIALTTLMVNARHLFYGISMVDKYRHTGKYKPYLIFALTDETYSLVYKDREGLEQSQLPKYYMLVSAFNHSYWITGTVLGQVLGAILPISTEGIDFSLTALFITVFTDQWIKTKNHIPALIGVFATILSRVLFDKTLFLIPAMLIITAALILFRNTEAGKEAA